ncbi:MAG: hypothetical protein M1815_001927 [Lichina confinis]|nr:MAG: hypothetical protein M1815_001927 [Lichina confinis]
MLRQQRLRDWDAPASAGARSQSVTGDRTSVPRQPALTSPPPSVRPDPAYIVASAASQIITNVQERDELDFSTADDGPVTSDPALVTPPSLKLVNGFLDHLLYNFLGVARSTSLGPLRAAIVEVLRPTLAREAIAGADQELQEYLGVNLERELSAAHEPLDPLSGWDLDAVWRRTRLRCMVYSSLGDMEEEEDDEGSESSMDDRPTSASQSSAAAEHRIVLPAVAIFLASTLEFLGEQMLLLAAQASLHRTHSKKLDGSMVDGASVASDAADRLVVEEHDVEKIALNASLGRLWRSWRKRLRSPSASFSRSISRDSFFSRRSHVGPGGSSRPSSFETLAASTVPHERSSPASLTDVPEEDVAANIALPMSDNDVEEIEVPGVADANQRSRLESRYQGPDRARRRRSLTVLTARLQNYPTSDDFGRRHGRSRSVPSFGGARASPGPDQSPDDGAFFTPLQSPDRVRGPSVDGLPYPQQADGRGNEPASATDPARRHHDRVVAGEIPADQDRVAWDREAGARQSSQDHPSPSPSNRGFRSNDVVEGRRHPKVKPLTNLDVGGVRRHHGAIISADRRSASPGAPAGESALPDAQDVRLADPAGMRPTAASSSSSSSSSSLSLTSSSQPARPHTSTRLIIQPDDEVEPAADPNEIGVAHTSNVPMLAPLSIPHTTAKRSGPTHLHQPNEPQVIAQQPSRPEIVLDGPQGQGSEPSERRHPRYHQDPQRLSPKHDGAYPSGVRSGSYGSVDAQGEVLSRPPPRGASIARTTSPLNPLEELTEDLLDDSDDASSSAAARHDATRNAPGVWSTSLKGRSSDSGSIRSSLVSPGIKYGSGSRLSDQRRPLASPTTATADRASVQRVYTPPATPNEATTNKTRRSDSLKGPGSPQLAHKIKGVVLGRSQDDADRASRAAPASVDDDDLVGARPNVPPKARDTERSFEELIRSDATLQFTLTPPSMRDMDGTVRRTDLVDSTGTAKKAGGADKQSRVSSRSGSSLGGDHLEMRKEQQQQQQQRRSHSTSTSSPDTSGLSAARSSDGRDSLRGASPSSERHTAIRTRSGGPVARDPRTDTASTQYFADFIRKTGPSTPIVAPGSSHLALLPARNQSQPSKSSPLSSVGAVANAGRRAVPKPARAGAAPRKDRLQAREPVTYQRNDTSDLVDFIRQGPPDGKQSISKAIAPFRTTMDSDDFKSMTNGKTIVEAAAAGGTSMSPSSTQNGSTVSHALSVPSSYASQARLLDDAPAMVLDDDDAPPIRRKQRRVKDPYAIDSDEDDGTTAADDDDLLNDDEDDDIMPVRKPPREEESLMDFLKRGPPPSAQQATPASLEGRAKGGSGGGGGGIGGGAKSLLKREAPGSIKSRFGRNESKKLLRGGGSPANVAFRLSAADARSSGSSSVAIDPPRLALRGAVRDGGVDSSSSGGSFLDFHQGLGGGVRGGSVSSSTIRADGPSSNSTTPAGSRLGSTAGLLSDADRASASLGAPRTPRKHAQQPRSAEGDYEGASALADFLRSSEPPPTTTTATTTKSTSKTVPMSPRNTINTSTTTASSSSPFSSSRQQQQQQRSSSSSQHTREEGGFSRMFRKKKTSAIG